MAKKISTLTIARQVAAAASKVKAVDLKILDLRKLTSFTDFFIIANGNSDRQVGAIADSIVETMKKKGVRPIGVEGEEHAQWILVDLGDVVAHIFYHPLREFYAIERLWADAKEVKVREVKKRIKKK